MVWCKLANEREEERRGEGLTHTDGGCTTNGEPYRQGSERKRERESDESSREEGGAYHTFLSLWLYTYAFFFLFTLSFPSFSSVPRLLLYPLFTILSFSLYTNVTRYSYIYIYSYIFSRTLIFTLYTNLFRVYSINFLRLYDKQNRSPLNYLSIVVSYQ